MEGSKASRAAWWPLLSVGCACVCGWHWGRVVPRVYVGVCLREGCHVCVYVYACVRAFACTCAFVSACAFASACVVCI